VSTRVTEMLDIEIPIIQAPMGFIARAQLASSVSNAGGMGIIETSSGQLDEVREEIAKMRDLTDRPWGVNIAQLFVRDLSIVDFIVENGVRFVTTSAGDPAVLVPHFKAAGITVFHVVPTLRGARKAIAAGVDGLVVEGVEGGGFKNADGASSMVLLPLIAAAVNVPIIAAGGITDGVSMAAAFVLGAEGVQMGTRMVSALESPVHQNWKNAIVAAEETDTVFLNQFSRPALRALKTQKTARLERELVPDYQGPPVMGEFARAKDLYFGGDMEASIALAGQVVGRIDAVKPVAEIIAETVAGYRDTIARLQA